MQNKVELSQAEIIEEFEMFSDWMEKYEHIIEIGKELEPMDEALKLTSQSRAVRVNWLAASTNEKGGSILRRFRRNHHQGLGCSYD